MTKRLIGKTEEESLINELKRLQSLEGRDSFFYKLHAELMFRYEREPFRTTLMVWAHRFIAPAITGLSLIFAAGGITYASQNSLPQDLLYPFKLISEETNIALTPSASDRAALRVQFAERRLEEVSGIQQADNAPQPQVIINTLNKFNSEVRDANNALVVAAKNGQSDPNEVAVTAVSIEGQMLQNKSALNSLKDEVSASTTDSNVAQAFDKSSDAVDSILSQSEDTIIQAVAQEQQKDVPVDLLKNSDVRFSNAAGKLSGQIDKLAQRFDSVQQRSETTSAANNVKKNESPEPSAEVKNGKMIDIVPEISPLPNASTVLGLEDQFSQARNALSTINSDLANATSTNDNYIRIDKEIYDLQLLLKGIDKNLGDLESANGK